MISIFKNFYNRPASINNDVVRLFMEQLSKTIENDIQVNLKVLPRRLNDAYAQSDVRAALAKLYHQKCAYCEQKTDLFLEHYRPKSIYPWLILEWSNILPVCHACNISRTNKFLTKGKEISFDDIYYASNVLLANMPLFKNEHPSLLHPEVDSPENHITFNTNGAAVGRTERGRYTIDAFKLNREPLLKIRGPKIDNLRNELKELAKAFFLNKVHLGGDNIVSNITPEFEHFYKKLYKLQQPENEFSSLYRAIWDNNFLLDNTFTEDNSYNEYITRQLLIWKQIFLLKKNKLLNTKFTAAITGFEVQNFEAIRFLSLQSLDASARWIFLTGENGYGKTAVLKAIAAGLTGRQLPNDEARFKIEVLSPSSIRYQRSIDNAHFFDVNEYIWQHDLFKPYTQLAAYGASRTRISDNYKNPGENNVLDNLFNVNIELLNIERFLIDIHDRTDQRAKYEAVVNALLKIVPQLAGIKVDKNQDILELKYFEKSDEPGQNFQEVPFNALATGMRSILAMVGDILCRFMINKNIVDTKDIEGIVIIDELDIHLHPRWQRLLPELLSEVFPKIQFIASTHSAIPLLGAPKNSIFLKVSRDIELGVQLERLTWVEENLPNMLPNVIYTSELFGMENISSIANENDAAIMTQDNIKEAEDFIANKQKFNISEINDQEFLAELKAAQRK